MQCSTPLKKPWEHAEAKCGWEPCTMMLSVGGVQEGYSLVHPCCSVICHSGELGWQENKCLPPEAHLQGENGPHQAQSPFARYLGVRWIAPQAYTTACSPAPQLGGLKRAMKRASYRLGGEKTRRNTSYQMQQVFTHDILNSQGPQPVATNIVVLRLRHHLDFPGQSWLLSKAT